jgi:adenine/guanine phosphoribosyltransferase-like PRPP-binding protein
MTLTSDEEIATELVEYLNGILRSSKYDLVMCIERRGLVLYSDVHTKLKSKIPFYSEKVIDRIDVSNKEVLLFDDSISSGSKACPAKKALLSKGAREVDIAVYLKKKSSRV